MLATRAVSWRLGLGHFERRHVWDEQMFRLYGMHRASSPLGRGLEERIASKTGKERGGCNAGCVAKQLRHEFRVVWPDGSVHWIRALPWLSGVPRQPSAWLAPTGYTGRSRRKNSEADHGPVEIGASAGGAASGSTTV